MTPESQAMHPEGLLALLLVVHQVVQAPLGSVGQVLNFPWACVADLLVYI